MKIETPPSQHPAMNREDSDRLYRRIAWRLIPFLFIAYLFSLIDRTNIGYAKLQFLTDLKFSEWDYGFGAGLFYAGYILLEVPSNLYLERIGVRKTLFRIMVIWGLATMLLAFVKTPLQFYAARFLLGVAEGGFYPGIMLYLTYWFPAHRRGRAFALFQMSNPIAGISGALVAGWAMTSLDGSFGLHGWQMLFIMEGFPPILLGILALYVLSDRPANARWLKPFERAQIERDLAATPGQPDAHGKSGLKLALGNPMVYVLALVYFTQLSAVTMISLWGPSILKELGIVGVRQISMISAGAYVVGFVGMYLIGRNSDRVLERRWHYVCCALAIGCGALLLAAFHANLYLAIAFYVLIVLGIFGSYAIFFTMPAALFSNKVKASGIALITMLGSTSGFFMPMLIGAIKHSTGSIFYGVAATGALSLCGALLVYVFIPKNVEKG